LVSRVVGVIQGGTVVRDDLGLLDDLRRHDSARMPRSRGSGAGDSGFPSDSIAAASSASGGS
jgi:hypothetical protein